MKKELIGLSREELLSEMNTLGESSFRVKQLFSWLYNKGCTDFSQMTNLGKSLRAKLEDSYQITRPSIVYEKNSIDRTRKWLVEFQDKEQVECVYIPEEDRGAVCISTQIGCAQKCAFCHTGTQRMKRNLTAGEIVSQFMVARDSYQEWPTPTNETRFLSNIVVMGMGEPLYNYDNLVKALNILLDPEGLALSRRKITVSTAGMADNIPRLADDTGVKLAISLHAPTNEVRNQIMPINRKFPLEVLMEACQEFQRKQQHRQYITMEYIMIKGLNDSLALAHDLVDLVEKNKLEVKFNLIPFNPWEGCPFEPSTRNQIQKFASFLESHHYPAPIRVSRGQDIMAACGQLKSAFKNKDLE